MSTDTEGHYYDKMAELTSKRVIRKYEWLIEPSREHSINLLLLQEIVDFLGEVCNFKKEKQHPRIALVIKNDRTLFEDPVVQHSAFHISKLANFLNLGSIVDGSGLSYVVDERGMVTIGRIPSELLEPGPRLTLKNISQAFNTIAFYIGKSTSEVYDSGVLIQINREGVWVKPCTITFDTLLEFGFPRSILDYVLSICKEMSETNKGGTFAVVKGDELEHCSSMLGNCSVRRCAFDELQNGQLKSLASLDGAVVVNVNKVLLGVGQRLEPPPSTAYTKEFGRGTRHNSAAMYSSAVDCVVFVVSENGPITVYFRGDTYKRCYGELFGPE